MTPPRTTAARAESRRSTRTGTHAVRSRSPARTSASASGKSRTSPRPARHASRGRRLSFIVTSFLVLGVLVVGVASLQAVVSQGSFRMQELTRHNLELQHEYGRLKLQVAELSSPGRIATEARRMGFHVPKPEDVRTLAVSGAMPPNEGPWTLGRPVMSLKKSLGRGP